MNVKRLIELLSTHDDDAEVDIFNGETSYQIQAVDAVDPEGDTVTIFTKHEED